MFTYFPQEGCNKLIQCTPLLVEKAGVAPEVTFGITARKQERVQVRDPLRIWNPWGRTHKVQNRSNQWLHKLGLGPTKNLKKKKEKKKKEKKKEGCNRSRFNFHFALQWFYSFLFTVKCLLLGAPTRRLRIHWEIIYCITDPSSQLLDGLLLRNLDIPDSVDTLLWGLLLQIKVCVHNGRLVWKYMLV